ncbi:hypothetical protein ACFQPF_17705 [Fictibacillus iocasae]|uniref:Lipoprotein n=1 Tax=Fictibacillus iocasae TaxID=2715437 RepID=A0ABW2NSM5_9BACL
MRRILLIIVLLMTSAFGCSSEEENELKWHSTKQAAIEAGLKEEDRSTDHILDEVTVEGETFVLYTMDDSVFVANIAEKGGSHAWYRANPGITVINVPQAAFETNTFSKKIFKVYLGVAEEQKETITIDNGGTVTPTVKNGMFYYIEPIKK